MEVIYVFLILFLQCVFVVLHWNLHRTEIFLRNVAKSWQETLGSHLTCILCIKNKESFVQMSTYSNMIRKYSKRFQKVDTEHQKEFNDDICAWAVSGIWLNAIHNAHTHSNYAEKVQQRFTVFFRNSNFYQFLSLNPWSRWIQEVILMCNCHIQLWYIPEQLLYKTLYSYGIHFAIVCYNWTRVNFSTGWWYIFPMNLTYIIAIFGKTFRGHDLRVPVRIATFYSGNIFVAQNFGNLIPPTRYWNQFIRKNIICNVHWIRLFGSVGVENILLREFCPFENICSVLWATEVIDYTDLSPNTTTRDATAQKT